MPPATHRSGIDLTLQARFNAAVAAASYNDLEDLLRVAAHRINVNEFDPATGQTALQRMPCETYSVATDLVSPITAALVVP